MASLTIRPGSRIRLKGQSAHIPDFFVVRCDRDRCWVRQQNWKPEVELNVRFTQISIPEAGGEPKVEAPSPPRDNVVYLEDYRRRKAH